MTILPYAVAAWLLVVGLWGVATSRNMVHLVTCLVVTQSSTYLVLLAVGFRPNAGPPVFADVPASTPAVDPIVQAMALTDIVVGATTFALLLAMTVQAHKRHGTLDPRALRPLERR